MRHDEYQEHVARFLDEMREVTVAKNADYSAGQDDAMANFYELSSASGVTPLQAWMCLAMKHVTAVMRYVKTGSVSSETIHGRFIDLANYMMLGDALVRDLEKKSDRTSAYSVAAAIGESASGSNELDPPSDREAGSSSDLSTCYPSVSPMTIAVGVDSPTVISIGADGYCRCNCATTCPLGRLGMENRCHRDELSVEGMTVVIQ